jgi:hypothetical protein
MNIHNTTQVRILEALCETQRGLKDFQQATVAHVMRLFNDPKHSHRILIADEVGLGKTIIARGIIADLLIAWLETILTAKSKSRPMQVIYICSNLALAEENRKKLAVFTTQEQNEFVREPSFKRLAEVAYPSTQNKNNNAVLEISTLTPSTSFSLTQGAGNMRERLIIFAAVLCVFAQSLNEDALIELENNLSDLFREHVQKTDVWKAELSKIDRKKLNRNIIESFKHMLLQPVDDNLLTGRNWLALIQKISLDGVDKTDSNERTLLRNLRQMFVHCCAANLQADLFILDEFQRFKDLLDDAEDNEQAMIARQVFRKDRKSKVLLLSATPFKAMTMLSDDEIDGGHINNLKQILNFLNLTPLNAYEPARKALQSEMLRLKQTDITVTDISENPRITVESILRPLIARTERSQIAEHVDTVLEEKLLDCGKDFGLLDIQTYIDLDRLSATLEANSSVSMNGQMMEFYKSAAWPLSFSTGYKLQDELIRQYKSDQKVGVQVRRAKQMWIPKDKINQFQLNIAKDAPNPKVRELTRYLFGDSKQSGPELLLWVPPSMPHYPLAGPFSEHAKLSKTLIFSAWAMVPRMLSGLLSYECERRTLGKRKPEKEYFIRYKRGTQIDEQHTKSESSRLIRLDASDLAYWSLLYPSKVLIDAPLLYSGLPLVELIKQRTAHFKQLLSELTPNLIGTRNSKHWYLFAPMLLDQKVDPPWSDKWLDEMKELKLAASVKNRLQEISEYLNQAAKTLGAMPPDLAEYLALLSIGSPAVCAYRALQHEYSEETRLLSYASRVALSFVSLFNNVSGSAVIRRVAKRKNWWGIAEYCAHGGLQAMLDEYLYMLAPTNDASGAVETIENVLGITPSNVKLWHVTKPDDQAHLRCHYAVPLGTQKTSDEAGQGRVVNIRESFNSPFRPFVLTSTSIGQEGLDFHWYSSEVVHWNLPENPIDFEQREGRINRYQSLVVRRRVVEAFKHIMQPEQGWSDLFDIAKDTPKQTDLVPFWHCSSGSEKLRRIVPLLPMSKEIQVYSNMLKILSLYRLVFGQPGQLELLEYLKDLNLTEDEHNELKRRLMIRLTPILHAQQQNVCK